jgi:hypothetical protein
MQQAPKVSQLIGFFNSKSSANVNAPARVLKRPANIHTKQISQGATPSKITAQSTPHLIVKQAPRKTLLSSLTSSSRTSLTSSDSSPKLSVIVAPPPPDLFTLPNELLIHVCSYLTLQELCGLSSTNKALHGTSSTGLLWLQFFKAEFEANTFVFYSDANKYQNAAWRIFYTSMKTLWARMRMFYVRSKRDMFVTDGKGEMTKLQPSSALRETNHTLRFDSKHNCYGYFFHWNIEKKLGNITKWGLDFIEQKSKPSYYVFVWRETVCEKLFEEPVLMLVSPKQSRLLAYSPQEGWYCINTKKMSRTNLPHIPATAEDGVCWIDDRRIAFTSQTEVNTAVFIYNITTKVVEKHIIDDNREIVSHKYMCTCPNTQDLVVMTKDGLMMLNLRTEKWTRLNSGPTSLQGPLSMSPNGTKLAYIAKRDESNLIFVLDTKKNKEFVLGQIKGAKNLLGWHSDNSLFVESSATYVTYSLVFIDTSLELADNEPFYFSNIVNKNTKIKSMQLGTAKVEIVV